MGELEKEKRLMRVEETSKKTCEDVVKLDKKVDSLEVLLKLVMRLVKPIFYLTLGIFALFAVVVIIDVIMVSTK